MTTGIIYVRIFNMGKLFYSAILLIFSLTCPLFGLTQKDVLVPYRVGEKFGLSDLKGKVKLKPQYDLVEPIGGGYFKYSNYTISIDTIKYYNGKIKVSKHKQSTVGVLKGKRAIINNSDHKHFTLIDKALLVGSQESYVSKNSNFYNLNGERLLKENVDKFRILATDEYGIRNHSDTLFITLFIEHYDNRKSVLIFDVINQKMIEPLLDRVNELTLDREESSESHLVFSYYDNDYQYFKERIYFNDSLKRHVKEPYTSQKRYGYDRYYGDDFLLAPEPPGDVGTISESGAGGGGYAAEGSDRYTSAKSTPSPPIKRNYYFQKVNDSLVKYGDVSLTVSSGQKIVFGDSYSSTQRQPLIYTDGKKNGLLYSDSLRSELEYDSLRYIRYNSNFLYLAGKKENLSNQWKIGVLNEKGEVIIPLMYSQLTPGILELAYEREDSEKNSAFYLRQQHSYNKDKNQPLSMSGSCFTVSQNGKMGLVDFSNQVLLPIEYDSIWKMDCPFLPRFVPMMISMYIRKTANMDCSTYTTRMKYALKPKPFFQ